MNPARLSAAVPKFELQKVAKYFEGTLLKSKVNQIRSI